MPMDPTRGSAPVWTGMVDVGAVTQPIPGAPRSALSILVALGIPVILCILVALRIPVSQCSPAALDTSVALWCWWPWVHPAPGQALLEPGTEGPNGQLHPFPPPIPWFLVLIPGFRPIRQLCHHLQPKAMALEQCWEDKALAEGIQGWFQLSQITAPAQDGEAEISTECQRLWLSKGFRTSLTPVGPWLEPTCLQVSQ